MDIELSGTHRTTYDAVFQHPISRNLVWRDVVSMLGAIDGIEQREHDGTLKVTRNGQTLVMHQPVHKQIADVQELMNLRRFLEKPDPVALADPASRGAHLLVVIDHRLARIYQAELRGAVPQRVVPYDRSGAGRHLHHVEEDATGQRKPELKSFYEAVAKTLQDAEKILLFGCGTGASSAMEQLVAVLRDRHPALAERVVGSVVVDEQHLSDAQLLAQARAFYEDLEK